MVFLKSLSCRMRSKKGRNFPPLFAETLLKMFWEKNHQTKSQREQKKLFKH